LFCRFFIFDLEAVLQVTEIPEPFELHIENNIKGNEQKSVVELTLDPFQLKKTYGFENKIIAQNGRFSVFESVIKHPLKKLQIALLRPNPNKYILSIQPDVDRHMQETVAMITCHSIENGCYWEGSFSDRALERPLKAKLIYKKDETNAQNYRMHIQTEFDYSGQPERLFSNSLHVYYGIVPAKYRKRSISSRKRYGDIRFLAELKSTHLASSLDTRAWIKIDRRIVGKTAIPIHTSLGLSINNAKQIPRSVEYSLETKTDTVKFMEAQLKLADSSWKTRIEKNSNKPYALQFYENNKQPSFVGEFNFGKYGAVFEFRDEKLHEVKVHLSAKMPNDYEAKIDLWHSNEKRKIQDVLLALQVNA
uniref:Dolichyl-diphosphooligosaccharide--protein glycosyltransferase subunit 1 n=1 Tax=Thelazia callipaeda TaxID=103827 RepID=A0A0N5D3T8_THECL